MTTTVGELLHLPILKSNSHILANSGLENAVLYVTVMEAPDFHFSSLDNDGFILTTLSTHHDTLEQINDVIRGLCEAHVAAIAIKLGRFVNEIHPSTVQIAEEHHVVLITLSSTVYFREVLSELLSVITGNQRMLLKQINSLNQSLFDAILMNHTIRDLLNLLCEHMECYCFCLNLERQKIAEATSLGTNTTLNAGQIKESVDHFFESFSGHFEAHEKHYFQEGNTLIFPCFVQDEMIAAFCIVATDPQTEHLCSLAQPIVSGISIKFLEETLKAQAEREQLSSILDDILFTQHSSEKLIADRLEFLNFTPQKNHLIVLLYRVDANYDERNYLFTLKNLQNIFSSKYESAIVFKRGREYIALISSNKENFESGLSHSLGFCKNEIARTERRQFDIGCSIPSPNLAAMAEGYTQAKRAVQFGRMIDPSQHLYLYCNYFELGLIACGVDSIDADTFRQRIINPIQEYDSQFKTELWSTLETCFMHDKLDHIADALHIHISTLRYRLQKIETMTGYSYFKLSGRMSLYFAYLLFNVSRTLNQS